MAWKGGRLTSASIKSLTGGTCHVFCAGKKVTLEIKKGERLQLDAALFNPKDKQQGLRKKEDDQKLL